MQEEEQDRLRVAHQIFYEIFSLNLQDKVGGFPVLANIWRISVLVWSSLCRLLNSSHNILQSSGLVLQLMTGDSAPGGIAVEPRVHIVDFNIKRSKRAKKSQPAPVESGSTQHVAAPCQRPTVL